MKELKQMNFHKPEQGEIGDCWRTCLACLLDAGSPEHVPQYNKDNFEDTPEDWQKAVNKTNEWLSGTFGLKFVEYPISADSLEVLRTYISHYYRDMYVVIGCNSKNGGHSVIMKNDNYMWDPSKDDSGCVGPMKDGFYWIGNLIRI